MLFILFGLFQTTKTNTGILHSVQDDDLRGRSRSPSGMTNKKNNGKQKQRHAKKQPQARKPTAQFRLG
jgi:hypothetical protein